MLMLAGLRQNLYVYARANLVSDFPPIAGAPNSEIVIEGFLSDCYFDATGALLYLVFKEFKQNRITLDNARHVLHEIRRSDPTKPDERLVVEGRQVAMVRYNRIFGLQATAQSTDELRKLAA